MCALAYAPYGAEGIIIRVEADLRRGIPGVDISGLPDGAVREARERVRAAFRNTGIPFPPDRVLINLAPAGVRKEGASLDLPIAVSVMAASGLVPAPGDSLMTLGELELSGRLRPVRGALAAVAAGLRAGIRDFIVPAENAAEAALLPDARIFAASTLGETVHALLVRSIAGSLPAASWPEAGAARAGESGGAGDADDGDSDPGEPGGLTPDQPPGDFAEVRGQARYKRALEIAAAGGHNLLAFGPPGAGKTMLARRLPSILPPLEPAEAVEVTRLHSLAGQLLSPRAGLLRRPPFRSPHHSASAEGILGGGRFVRPGEITLAHWGVLFLDEAPEFRAHVLQALREPLEERMITIARAEGQARLPADFQLVLAANACPCGRLGAPPGGAGGGANAGDCFCGPDEIRRYWKKLGSALLDRVELRVAVTTPALAALAGAAEETSAEVAVRVARAVGIQRDRFRGTAIRRNARMGPAEIDRYCALSPGASSALRAAADKLGVSGRAFHGILRTARTIADLEGRDALETAHILEAVEHRRLGDDPYDVFVPSE